jgi:O-antigen/teichoic acid export membrane protein
MVVALTTPRLLLQVVFHHAYVTAAPALAPLVASMIVLSVTVILTMYLLAIGRRWVAAVLVLGSGALTIAVAAVHGAPRATAVAVLVVQSAVLFVVLFGFTVVHRVRVQRLLRD